MTAATTFWSTTAVAAPIVFASSTETTTEKLDQKTCTGLINLVKQAPPEQLPSQLVTAAQRATPDDCTLKHKRNKPTGVLAGGCWDEWNTWSWVIGFGPLETAVFEDHVNVGWCYDDSVVTRNWGPDCAVTSWPAYGSDINWCGIWQEGTWNGEPGDNFDIFVWATPWWKHYGWARWDIYGDGSMCCYRAGYTF